MTRSNRSQYLEHSKMFWNIWDKVFKSGLSKFWWRHPLKNLPSPVWILCHICRFSVKTRSPNGNHMLGRHQQFSVENKITKSQCWKVSSYYYECSKPPYKYTDHERVQNFAS